MYNYDNLFSDISLLLNGTNAPNEFLLDLLEVTVDNSLHMPDVATLIVHDARLHWIDESIVMPGTTVQIQTRVGTMSNTLFDGEIVEVEANFDSSTQRLIIRAFDRLHRLARGRQARSFVNVTDQDLIIKIAEEAGLIAQVDPTPLVYPYVFQNNETNLEFLQKRASALGYLLYVRGKILHCSAPHPSGTLVQLEWGRSLREFRPRLTTIGQINKVVARGWDPATKQSVLGQQVRGQGIPSIGQMQDGGTLAQSAFSIEAQTLITHPPIRTQAIAQTLAESVANQHASTFIEAEGTAIGIPTLMAGVEVQIQAVGDRFSGTYFVTGTTHVYNQTQSYFTDFTVSGLHPTTLVSLIGHSDSKDKVMGGLFVGLITDNQDLEGQGRVKVKYPWLSDSDTSDWARVVIPGGGNERGIEFLPEVNDEVLVGFEMGDIHHPYVLGGLWNGVDAPAAPQEKVTNGGNVQQRVIRSRSGHIITLDDSEEACGISIVDKNGNKIMLDSVSNNLSILVQGNATIQAQGDLTLESQGGQVQIKGMSVNVNAEAGQAQIKGLGVSVTGEPANVDIKGTIINLN